MGVPKDELVGLPETRLHPVEEARYRESFRQHNVSRSPSMWGN